MKEPSGSFFIPAKLYMELIFFLMVFFAISVAGGALYVVYLPFKYWLLRTERFTLHMSRKINRIYVGILLLTVLVITYIGLFPDDAFYAHEFKKVTLQELPPSAEFISKSATYPDFHGEYLSQSEIKLSKSDYSLLLWKLYRDDHFTRVLERESFGSKDINKNIIYHFIRNTDNEGSHLYIGFKNDKQTLYVDVFYW